MMFDLVKRLCFVPIIFGYKFQSRAQPNSFLGILIRKLIITMWCCRCGFLGEVSHSEMPDGNGHDQVSVE